MRVCFDISPLSQEKITGVGEYLLGIVKEYSNHNIDNIGLFGFVPWNFDKTTIYKLGLMAFNIKLIRVPNKISRQFYIYWQKFGNPKVEEFIGYNYDIYHVFDWYTPSAHSTKVISTVYDLTTISDPSFHKKSNVVLQTARLNKLNNADGIVCISKSTKSDLIDFIPDVKNKKITIAYPGIKHSFLEHQPNKTNYKFPYILCVCTREPRKNLELLEKAFLEVADSIPHTLILVGASGWGGVSITSHPRILVLEYATNNQLSDLYANCDFSIYIPKYEGFGLPIIESFYYGKNVITGIHSSLPEASSIFGIKVQDINNQKQVSNAILKANRERINDDTTITQGRRKFAERFMYRNSIKDVSSLYEECLKT